MTNPSAESEKQALSASGLNQDDLKEFDKIWKQDDLTKDAAKAQMMEYTERLMQAVWLISGDGIDTGSSESQIQQKPRHGLD